ncbi:methionine ABC transporter permease [Galactobacter valiniphilus]|uniref:methionine ABC transporter permease n=1 Tax=Galactobacter valiniphilus TaxID=2676122 RepID=UPI003898F518
MSAVISALVPTAGDMWEPLTQPAIWGVIWTALGETLTMVFVAGVATVIIGLALGVLLWAGARGGILPKWLDGVVNVVLSWIIVNITRSIPYAILMLALIPFTRLIVGTSLGPMAASVSLTIGTVPFFARLVEAALREVDRGKLDAAAVMGSSRWQLVSKVALPEARPALVAAITTTVVTLVGYSAMAGLIGGGGLGRLAYNYGYQRFEVGIMLVVLVIMIVLVQLIQFIGDRLTRLVDHR